MTSILLKGWTSMFRQKTQTLEHSDRDFNSYKDFSKFVKEIDKTVVTVIKEQRGMRLDAIIIPHKMIPLKK
jgi:hypothetical protein